MACSSCRLQGYLIHDYLTAHGVESEIFLSPLYTLREFPWTTEHARLLADAMDAPIVLFQNLRSTSAKPIIEHMKARGITTVHVQCDYYPDNELQWLCDYIITTSTFLQNYFTESGIPTLRIIDPIEDVISREELTHRYETRRSTQNLKLVWVGHADNYEALDVLKRVLNKPEYQDFTLTTISNHRDAAIKWELDTVTQHIRAADIGIVPTKQGPFYEAKSQNRITLHMALGLPVVMGEILAYREVVTDGVNGLFATTEAEWQRALDLLRDPDYRRTIAENAYEQIVPQFTLEKAGEAWVAALTEIMAHREGPLRNPVSAPVRWFIRHRLQSVPVIHYTELALQKHNVPKMLQTVARATLYLPFAPRRTAGLYGWLLRKIVHRVGMMLGFE